MTLSSAEKHSTTCPWRFPSRADESCCLQLPDITYIHSFSKVDSFATEKQVDMGNNNATPVRTQTSLSSEKNCLHKVQEIVSRANGLPTSHKITPTDEPVSVSHVNFHIASMSLDENARNSKHTKDHDSNSRPASNPNSRSGTPVLGKKSPGHQTMGSSQNNSNSSNSLKDSQAKDIMISYSHLDKEIMIKLKDTLERNNISVWVDVVGLNAGVNFLNKIGQAIIDSKMFMTLLTDRTVASKFCQDELALAYISNKPIFPVSLQPQNDIFPNIPTGMKLQLARFEWTQISLENFDTDVQKLLDKLKACLDDLDGAREEKDDVAPLSPTDRTDRPLSRKPPVLKRKSTRGKIYNKPNRSLSRCNSIIEQPDDLDSSDEFWDRNFGDAKTVPWDKFETAFIKSYEKQLNMTYTSSDKDWFIDILKRELEVENDFIHKEKYKDFISEEVEGERVREQHILKCVNDLAVENYTMREVFNMESSVRLDAINNLSKFGSVAVVEALLDLLDDAEHDVRASACISLAKSKAGDISMKIERLMRCLRDTDRFVRESACIALGYLKANNAVPALLQIWRNDYITSVRDAAELALKQIGGDEVNKAMQMTKVLTAEIEDLIKILTGKTTSPKNSSHTKLVAKAGPFNTLPHNTTGFSAQFSNNINSKTLPLAPVPQKNS